MGHLINPKMVSRPYSMHCLHVTRLCQSSWQPLWQPRQCLYQTSASRRLQVLHLLILDSREPSDRLADCGERHKSDHKAKVKARILRHSGKPRQGVFDVSGQSLYAGVAVVETRQTSSDSECSQDGCQDQVDHELG